MALYLETADATVRAEIILIYTKRMKTILQNPLYELSFFLQPKNRHLQFTTAGITRIIRTLVDYGNDWYATSSELDQLQRGATAFKRNEGPFAQNSLDVVAYWNHVEVANSFPDLAQIALQLDAICPHSMACERAFSILGWLNSARRSNMTISNLEMSAQVYDHLRREFVVDIPATIPFSSLPNLPNEIPQEMDEDELDAVLSVQMAFEDPPISLDHGNGSEEEELTPDLMKSLQCIIPLTPSGLNDFIHGANVTCSEEETPISVKKQKLGLKKILLRVLEK